MIGKASKELQDRAKHHEAALEDLKHRVNALEVYISEMYKELTQKIRNA